MVNFHLYKTCYRLGMAEGAKKQAWKPELDVMIDQIRGAGVPTNWHTLEAYEAGCNDAFQEDLEGDGHFYEWYDYAVNGNPFAWVSWS